MNAFVRRNLPLIALACFAFMVIIAVMTAGPVLGWDYTSYVDAAGRALHGTPLYDATADVAGPRGTYLYPPPFAIAVMPFAVLPDQVGLWLWVILGIASFVAAVAILPVDVPVRWAILLLGALDWPLLYSFRLGQVGPLLFLLFAIGWRWMDRPIVLGLSMAAGGLIKVQPLILMCWAILVGKVRAATTALVAVVAAAAVATILFGTSVWLAYRDLLGRISTPITTPHNFTPGAIAYQQGVPEDAATVIQVLCIIAVVLVMLISIAKTSTEVSYLTAVIASQLLSPILWDHYAVLLLLPVAWLLQRGRWWAAAIPLLTSIPAILLLPPAVYLVVFAMGFLGPLVVDLMDRRRGAAVAVPLTLGSA